MKKTAVVVVDVQQGLVAGDQAVAEATAFTARLESLLARARAAGVPVVHVQDDGTATGSSIRRGTPGWELALSVVEEEPVVHKSDDVAFDVLA